MIKLLWVKLFFNILDNILKQDNGSLVSKFNNIMSFKNFLVFRTLWYINTVDMVVYSVLYAEFYDFMSMERLVSYTNREYKIVNSIMEDNHDLRRD
jgi:hypothetical protein